MGEHHLHSQSPRASHERKRACPQGAWSILQARVTRRGLRVAPCAASAASEGRKGRKGLPPCASLFPPYTMEVISLYFFSEKSWNTCGKM